MGELALRCLSQAPKMSLGPLATSHYPKRSKSKSTQFFNWKYKTFCIFDASISSLALQTNPVNHIANLPSFFMR